MVPFPSPERASPGRSRHRQAAATIAVVSLVSLLAACGSGHDEPQAPAAGNVATGQSSPGAVVAAWLASPGHCANIMNAAFVDVGFGFAPAMSGASTYATLVLARPR